MWATAQFAPPVKSGPGAGKPFDKKVRKIHCCHVVVEWRWSAVNTSRYRRRKIVAKSRLEWQTYDVISRW